MIVLRINFHQALPPNMFSMLATFSLGGPIMEWLMIFARQLAPGGLAITFLLFALGTDGLAQQTTGTPGSPGATTTSDGKDLPPPPPKFGAVINLEARKPKPYGPPRRVPPKRPANTPPVL